MEVHAHTHTPRKKWTHYFWEFLMLFLAVFCGFLAELQLEHYIEHQREKQYMRSLLEDLYSDTATLKRVYNRAIMQNKRLDSLIELGSYAIMNKENIARLYMLHGQTTRFLNIRFEDGTSSQLKNAGGLRLIRSKKVVNAIRQYWNQIESFYRVRDRLEMAGEKISDVSSRIFYNKFFIITDDPLEPPLGIKADAALINDDPNLIAEYINRIVSKSIRTRIYLTDLSEAMQTTEQLIILIKQEYHLK
jgi:hypothetical protein